MIDQYLKSAQALCDWVSAQQYFKDKNAVMKYVAPPSYLDVLQFYICLSTNDATRFVGTISGDGFEKLGFVVPFNGGPIFTGVKHLDLSQPPVILIQMDQLPSGISNGFGTLSFAIPNNASYGGKILYQNHQKHSC